MGEHITKYIVRCGGHYRTASKSWSSSLPDAGLFDTTRGAKRSFAYALKEAKRNPVLLPLPCLTGYEIVKAIVTLTDIVVQVSVVAE